MIYLTKYDILVNLFLCVTDYLVALEAHKRIYGDIQKYGRSAKCAAFAGVVFLALSPAFYHATYFTVLVFFLLLPLYPKNFRKKLLFESCILSILFSYMVILNDITNMLHMVIHADTWAMSYLALYHTGLWVILLLCPKMCHNSFFEFPLSLWGVFLAIPLSTFLSSVLFIIITSYAVLPRPLSDIFHLLIQTTFLFINIALFIFLKRFSAQLKKEQERRLLEQQLYYQEQHYHDLIEASDNVRKLRHDMKNHLQTISLLYRGHKVEELEDYLSKTSEILERTEQVVSTGNPSMDALLNIKLNEIRKKGVFCSKELSLPQNLNFPFSDCVTILGNILDNAAASCEAAAKKGTVSPEISLSIAYRRNSLLITVSNTCTDLRAAEYGTGMKNVADVVKKYSGTMQTKVTDGRYITDILLYDIRAL